MNEHKKYVSYLKFDFTEEGQTLTEMLETDERYNCLQSITFTCFFYQSPVEIESFSIDGDSKIFEGGLNAGMFRDEPYELNYPLNKKRNKVQLKLKDASPFAFTEYSLTVGLEFCEVE